MDHSIKYPVDILEDVPINMGEFYVPIDFVLLGMGKGSGTQINLGRPFLATVGCKMDVKEGKLTFDVGEHHTEFGLFKDFESSPYTFSCCRCDVLDLDELMNIDMSPNDPSSFDCALFEGYRLDGVMVEFVPTTRTSSMLLMRII